MRPPPLSLSFKQLNYTWLLADDEIGSRTGSPSCEVCNYLADVGYFRLADAFNQFDILLDILESGELGEEPGFPTMDDIDGLGVKDLTRLGIMLPPIHPHCRCDIVFI